MSLKESFRVRVLLKREKASKFTNGTTDMSSSVLRFDFLRSQFQVFASSSLDSESQKIYCFLVTDSANAFAASREFNARALEKTTRLGMAYLRDVLHLLCLSYISAPFNIADLGTKLKSSLVLFGKIISGNRFVLGFISRKELKSLIYLFPIDTNL